MSISVKWQRYRYRLTRWTRLTAMEANQAPPKPERGVLLLAASMVLGFVLIGLGTLSVVVVAAANSMPVLPAVQMIVSMITA